MHCRTGTCGRLSQPLDLTEDRFPIIIVNGEHVRVFRTGDLCVWTENHTLLFLGRKDQQIQIRGHRVELAEIETILRSDTDVSMAVVATHTNGDVTELAAFVAPRASTRTDCSKRSPNICRLT